MEESKNKKNKIKLFEEQQVRIKWDEEAQKYWFSIVDVCALLTDSDYQTARNYWKWLKNKLIAEGSEVVSNTNQLKMLAPDGKMRLTDVGDTEQILRLIQSIPSKKYDVNGGNVTIYYGLGYKIELFQGESPDVFFTWSGTVTHLFGGGIEFDG